MTDFYEVQESLSQANKLFESADLMRRYRMVTEQHGPSQALLDFVNHDRNFGKEIGLESFETFSTQTQHEIMLSQLNINTAESIAMEGFVDFLKKYRGWLLLGGFIIPPLWLGAIAGFIAKDMEVKVPLYSEYMDLKKDFVEAAAKIKALMRDTPSGTEDKAWDDFENKASEINDLISVAKDTDTFRVTGPEESGWTPAKFHSEAEFLEDQVNRFEAARKEYAGKVERMESFISQHEGKEEFASLSRRMNRAISETAKSMRKVNSIMLTMKALMAQTAKGFVFEKK